MIRHHPGDMTLIGCAAGILPALHQQVVAVHLAQCAECRAALRLDEELGGALIEAAAEEPLAEDALGRALAALDEPARESVATEAEALSPGAIETLIRSGRWRRLGPGIRLLPLAPRDASGTRLDLIRVAPGIALPEHDHTGPEITCVIHGGYADETGEYHAGDVAEGEAGLAHRPRALPGEECVCMIATTGYLRARSLIARLVQPLFGI